jgi:diaminopimelate decarboxylase
MDYLWPITTQTDARGALWIGGCELAALADEFGTPLYVFDEATLRAGARAYKAALAAHYPASAQPSYASKAYLCSAVAQLFAEEEFDLDVVSGGELHVALQAGFPPQRIHFHGNNKSQAELQQAIAAGVGRIVVDNFHELALLTTLSAARGAAAPLPIWLRLAPGVSAHTHHHIQTGQEDTKFGFSLAAGAAARAVALALAAPGLALRGLHAHVGSQIYDPAALAAAAARLVAFAAEMRAQHGFALQELSPGGGWGVPMTAEDPPAPLEPYVAALSQAIVAACRRHALPLPHLVLEPGRSLMARAGVALYRVGARKEIPGVRTYVSVDGGMADNIRPALYGARYAARPARSGGPATEIVTIAGKYCESGDVLIRDIALPRPAAGDLLAIPMAGAYTLAMASNYNQALRPAVALVRDGRPQLIQRRETYADLTRRDLPLAGAPELRGDGRLFYKYHALGNDYLVLDPAAWPQPPGAGLARAICDRRRGVGADGVLWGPLLNVEPMAHSGLPTFALRLFNPDGSEFEKSGNGLRIFARYLWDRGLARGPDFALDTPGGLVTARVLDAAGTQIALEMGRISFRSDAIGLAGPRARGAGRGGRGGGAAAARRRRDHRQPPLRAFSGRPNGRDAGGAGRPGRGAGAPAGAGTGALPAFSPANQRAVRRGGGSPHAAH